MTSDDDIRALRQSVSEPAAFHALFVRHHAAIRRYLHARVGDAGLAEDLAAETFPRAFAARARFRDQGHGVRAWLFQIATNLLRDEIRASHRRSRAAAPVALSVAAPELPADPALGALLRQLPRDQLEVLLLHAWADLSYEEIAAVLGNRVGTVRSRLHRARARLRRTLPTLDPARPTVRPGRSTT